MAWMIARDESSYLAHHGIKGQKWGVRRFQNEDGSYTAAGKERRNSNSNLKRLNDVQYKKIDSDGGFRKYLNSNEPVDVYERHNSASVKELQSIFKQIDENTLKTNIINSERKTGYPSFNLKDIHKIYEISLDKKYGEYTVYADIEANGPAPAAYVFALNGDKLTNELKDIYLV